MTASSASSKSFLRRALTENLGLKILALAAAIGLFVIVSGEYEQRPVAVDVVVLPPPPSSQKMLVSEIPDQVQVTLQGSRPVLNSVRRSGLPPIQMDLHEGTAHYYDFARNLEPPAGTSVVEIVPPSVYPSATSPSISGWTRTRRSARVAHSSVTLGGTISTTLVPAGGSRFRAKS